MALQKNKKYFVYWIRDETHVDVFTQGYVGISCNPHHRLQQHVSSAKYKNGQYYKPPLKRLLLSGEHVFSIILSGNLEYCANVEYLLRPHPNTAWNIAAGGELPQVTHGLSGTPAYKAYHNMLTRKKSSVCQEWLGDEGLAEFIEFYTKLPKGVLVLKKGETEFNPETVEIVTKKEASTRFHRTLKVKGSEELFSAEELGQRYGIKPNTLIYKMRRGMSIDKALIKGSKSDRRNVTFRGVTVEYSGRLTDSEIGVILVMRANGSTLKEIGQQVGIDGSQVSRVCTRFEKVGT